MASATPTVAPPQPASLIGSLDRSIRTRKLLRMAGCLAGGRRASSPHGLAAHRLPRPARRPHMTCRPEYDVAVPGAGLAG